MSLSEIYLLALIVIFAVPYLVWRLGRTEFVAPLVVVQIVSGILLGPGVLGALFPSYYAAFFPPAVVTTLNGVAWWAVMVFVWLAGMELDLREAWRRRAESGLVAGLALGLPLLCGGVAALILLRVDADAWIGPAAQPWQFVAGVGMACAVTALPILILLMQKLAILRRPLGQRVLRYASLDDVAIWGVLALILLDWERIGRQLGFLAGFGPLAWGYRILVPRLPEADRWYVGVIWLALCGFVADWCGLHFMVGAFLAGVVSDEAWYGRERLDAMREHVLLLVMPVFFLSTGLRTSWSAGGPAVFLAAALFLVAAVSGKLLGLHIAGRLLRWPRGEAALIGWLLQTKALIMILFVNVLLDKHLVTAASFTALLLMAVASTMLTIPMASRQAGVLETARTEGEDVRA